LSLEHIQLNNGVTTIDIYHWHWNKKCQYQKSPQFKNLETVTRCIELSSKWRFIYC